MLGTTIQALEVQRMTLSTLKTMNVQMTDLRDAMKVTPAASGGSAGPADVGSMASSFGAEALMQAARNAMGGIAGLGKAAAPAAEPASAPTSAPEPTPRPRAEAAEPPAVAASGVVDPMQWWGALTKQFTQLAATALKDSSADAARNLAGAMVKQGMEAASDTMLKAATVPAAAVAAAARPAAKPAAKPASAAKKAPARKTAARAAKTRAS